MSTQLINADMPAAMLHHHHIFDLSFENHKGAYAPQLLKEAPEVGSGVEVKYQTLDEKQNLYEVVLKIEITVKSGENELFIVSVDYSGVFTINGSSEEEQKRVMLIDCPQILFPYARSIITLITANSGFPPVNMPHIDFSVLYEQQQKNEGQEDEDGTKVIH